MRKLIRIIVPALIALALILGLVDTMGDCGNAASASVGRGRP